jgi:hypothetical protein
MAEGHPEVALERRAFLSPAPPGETKSGRGRVFPFKRFPSLAPVLEEQRQARWAVERERGVAVTHVFKQLRDIGDAWRSACKRASLKDRRFHDLRRYAVMRLVRAAWRGPRR